MNISKLHRTCAACARLRSTTAENRFLNRRSVNGVLVGWLLLRAV